MPSEIRVDTIKNRNGLGDITPTNTGTIITGDITITTPFYNNNQSISSNYTVSATKNSMSVGPITINSGVTVTVSSGGYWTII